MKNYEQFKDKVFNQYAIRLKEDTDNFQENLNEFRKVKAHVNFDLELLLEIAWKEFTQDDELWVTKPESNLTNIDNIKGLMK